MSLNRTWLPIFLLASLVRQTVAGLSPFLKSLEPVPYLGTEEPYFLGSGVAGAGGDTAGKWDFLIGPDYTSPNFITEETLSLKVDGKSVPLVLKIHRARKTGIFLGSGQVGHMKVLVADYSTTGATWVARLVRVVNVSGKALRVSVRATIDCAGSRAEVVDGEAIQIEADKGAFCFGGETKNWAKRDSLITFTEKCLAGAVSGKYEVSTSDHLLGPGQIYTTGLYHFQTYAAGRTPQSLVQEIRGHSAEADIAQSTAEWNRWLDSGKHFRKRTVDGRAWDVVEAGLLACKMQQNRDGGTIAGTRRYANSYIRDTHGAVRLFLATGHYPEARKAIETIHHKWSVAGFIPNWWSMGSDSFIGQSFNNNASEITAYYVLMVRDYLAATKDRRFVDSLSPSIKFAIDSQLDFMAKNDWRITFNGDETEQYCVQKDGQIYGERAAFPQWHADAWSFPSAALVCASTEFYIHYLRQIGGNRSADDYQVKVDHVRKAIDSTFLTPTARFHRWARYKNGSIPNVEVPNYDLIPLWAGAKLDRNAQIMDAVAMKRFVEPKSGYLPTAPPAVMGFCGHNLSYMLYDLTKLKDPDAKNVFKTMMNSGLLGCWGTVSEFYGPNGTPNGHNFRVFESGITGEALVKYLTSARR